MVPKFESMSATSLYSTRSMEKVALEKRIYISCWLTFSTAIAGGFRLRLRWAPMQDNANADSMTRLGVEDFGRLCLNVIRRVYVESVWAVSVRLDGQRPVRATST